MANKHFGNIGDIWKHLPLAEVLRLERCRGYWETHAGSAFYELKPSPGRDYGVYYFYEQAGKTGVLGESAYMEILRQGTNGEGELEVFPGSPLVAMKMGGTEIEHYLFCDIDGASVQTIREAAKMLGLPEKQVTCLKADGVAMVKEAAEKLTERELGERLIHIDPYEPFTATDEAGMSPGELFCTLTRRGARTVLWYGCGSAQLRTECHEQLRGLLSEEGLDSKGRVWIGEIRLQGMEEPEFRVNPGVQACGVVMGNLAAGTTEACAGLGRALVDIYAGSSLAGGESGALRFEVLSFT